MTPTCWKLNKGREEAPGLFLCSWESNGNLIYIEEKNVEKEGIPQTWYAYISIIQEQSMSVPTYFSSQGTSFYPELQFAKRMKWLPLQMISPCDTIRAGT